MSSPRNVAGEIGPAVAQGRVFVFHGDVFTIGHVLYAFAADGCGAATCAEIATIPVDGETGRGDRDLGRTLLR